MVTKLQKKDPKVELSFKTIERWLMYLGSAIEALEISTDNQEVYLVRKVRDEILTAAFTGEK